MPPPNYKIIMVALQPVEARMVESSSEEVFLIRVDVDLSFYSKSNKISLKGLSLNECFRVPCSDLTLASQERVKNIVLYMLRKMDVPFQLDHIFFTHRHLNGTCNKLLPGDDDSWVEKLQNSLRAMRSESHNANCNLLPLNLKIKKKVWISDDEFRAWSSWYDEKERADPSFLRYYQELNPISITLFDNAGSPD